jgi:signal transduction histidine kinase
MLTTSQIENMGARSLSWQVQQYLIDAFDANIAILDGTGTILQVNRHWCDFSANNGGPAGAGAWVGKNYLDSVCVPENTNPIAQAVAADYDARDVRRGIESVLAGKKEHFNCTYPCHSPSERRWFELRAHYLGAHEEARAIVQHINVTQAYVNVCELRAANDELQALTYALAHDLRTPLRAIHGYASLVDEHIDQSVSQVQPTQEPKRLLDRIRAAAEEVANMLEYVMQAVRMVTADLHIEPIDLASKVEQIWTQVCMAYATQHAVVPELVLNKKMPVLGDRILIHSVLMNLFSNAVKYAEPSRPCKVRFYTRYLIPPGGIRAVLTYVVEDNGMGFNRDDHDHLFRPFYRLHMGRGISGFGLGLALTKRVIERHGGQIWAQGEAGKGASFFFTIG